LIALDIIVLRFSNYVYVYIYPLYYGSITVVAAYAGTLRHFPDQTRVESRVDPRGVDVITTLTTTQLPHNKLALCSPPTRLADCGVAAVTVDPSGPPSITCVEPCRHARPSMNVR
jgi:hypothetical protein